MGITAWVMYLHDLTSRPEEFIWSSIYGLIVYTALGYSYFHIFNMSETARRIRILYEIYTSKQLKASDIASLYNANDMLNNRLERLLSIKQIKLVEDRYFLDGKLFYYIARIVAGWGYLLGFSFFQDNALLQNKKIKYADLAIHKSADSK